MADRALVELKRSAEEYARGRGERLTTCHLLAALAERPSPAQDLLGERRLTVEILLKASRVIADEPADTVARALEKARDAGRRAGHYGQDAVHLLVVLLADRASAACRAMAQCGIDITRLRTQAAAIASGAVAPRRLVGADAEKSRERASAARPTLLDPKLPSPARRLPSAPKGTPPRERMTVSPASGRHASPREDPMRSSKRKLARPATGRPERGPWEMDARKFPQLTRYAKNLTQLSAEDALERIVARDEAVELVLDVLGRREAKSPCLVGLPGVGKSAILHGVAARMCRSELLSDARVLAELDPSVVLNPGGARTGVDPLLQIVEEAKKSSGKIVLAIENVTDLLSFEGSEGVAQLRLALAKGEIVCVATAGPEGYKRIIEADATLRRVFTPVEIEEPSVDEADQMVRAAAGAFETHHTLKYEDEALLRAVEWSAKYVATSALPEKALSVLDLAGARAKRKRLAVVGVEHVAQVVTELSGVPEERLLETDSEKLLRLESLLEAKIVGHKEQLARIATILRRSATRIHAKRPLGSFLLLGPTGVGKTETARAIAECLFLSEEAMTRLDLSEFAEPHSIARLIGAPPGYVGHEAGGQLTEAVRRRPYQVILLDEVEKAHRDVLEAFLQVFDEGRLTDGRGKTVDFTNSVLVLTSNLGADVIPRSDRGRIGFAGVAGPAPSGDVAALLVQAAREALPPELFNRFDDVLGFGALSRDEVREIAKRMLARFRQDLFEARALELDMSDDAIETLLDTGGFDLALGARPMRRAIERFIEAPIADLILRGDVSEGDTVLVGIENSEIVVDALKATERRVAS